MACVWIVSEEVREALGRPTEEGETAWGGQFLELVTQAANDYAFEQRAAEGWDDDPVVCPSARVRLGTVMYAVREFVTSGGDTGLGFEGGTAPPSLASIRSKLGLSRFRVDGTVTA